jgi:hypothetical protein
LQALARTTTRRKDQKTDNKIWTAPILYSVEDRETRWELEDLMRGPNLYPTFHWNRETVGLVKEMRTALKEKFPEDTNFIRIRPEEREGRWKLKADVKPRKVEGMRFRLGAVTFLPCALKYVRANKFVHNYKCKQFLRQGFRKI